MESSTSAMARPQQGIDAALGVERDGDQHRAEHDLPVFAPALVGKVEQRLIVVDRAIGDTWLVSSGLAPGDRVIVDGLQKLKADMVVTPKPAAPPPAEARRRFWKKDAPSTRCAARNAMNWSWSIRGRSRAGSERWPGWRAAPM